MKYIDTHLYWHGAIVLKPDILHASGFGYDFSIWFSEQWDDRPAKFGLEVLEKGKYVQIPELRSDGLYADGWSNPWAAMEYAEYWLSKQEDIKNGTRTR